MRDAKKFSLLIQLSLAIPNQWGLPQLMLEEVEGQPLFIHSLTSLVDSESLNGIWVVCSSESCDDGIESLVKKFSKGSKIPVFCLRLPPDRDWSITRKNLHRMAAHPERFLQILGVFSLDGFSYAHERILFDTAILVYAEYIPLLSAAFLDKVLSFYSQEICFIPWGPLQAYLPVLPFREVESKSQELRSELAQNWDQQHHLIQRQCDKYGVSPNDSKKKLKCFREKNLQCWSIFNLFKNVLPNGRQLSRLLTEEPLMPNFPVCTQDQLTEIRAQWPLVESVRSHCQTKETTLNFFKGDKFQEMCSAVNLAESNPRLKLSAEHLLLDISFATHESLSSVLAQFSPKPFVVTLGCFKDPNQLPDLTAIIAELKKNQISFLQIKTSKIPPPSELRCWIEAGLNGILLDLNSTQEQTAYLTSCSAIESLIQVKESYSHPEDCVIYLQIPFLEKNLGLIQDLHARFEFLVDGIIVLPSKDGLPPIHWTPLETSSFSSSSQCLWNQNTSACQVPDKLFLCEEWNQETWPLSPASFETIKTLRGKHTPCLSCEKRRRSNGFHSDSLVFRPLLSVDKKAFLRHYVMQSLINHLLSCVRNNEISILKDLVFVFQKNNLFPPLNVLVPVANHLSEQQEHAVALDLLERILQSNPLEINCLALLEKMETSLSKK